MKQIAKLTDMKLKLLEYVNNRFENGGVGFV